MKTEPSEKISGSIGFHGRTAAIVLQFAISTLGAAQGAPVYWTDGAGDMFWSSSANWTAGLPGGNDVAFTNAGASHTLSAATSLLDTSYIVNSLAFNNTSGNSQYLYLQQSGASLNIGGTLTVANGGTASLGGAGGNTVTASGGVSINNGSLNVNSGATLAVSNSFTLGYANNGYTATAALNLASGAIFHVGTPGAPASMTVASHANGGGVTTATFAPDSSLNPDMTLYLSTLSVGSGYGANGTVDLTKYTGPLSIGTLQVGDGNSGSGQFTFGNATNNRLTFPSLTINNGSLNVNSGATLAVTNSFTLGYANNGYTATAALNLASGAIFHVGTPGTPASMTVASHAIGGNGTTATFAPDSSLNPDMTLYLSTLSVGSGYYGANGTVDLTKYTGPLSIGTLQVGDGYSGRGQFTFGNATNNQLTFSSLTINNGSLNVNSGATLAVTNSFTLGYANNGYTATAALNLAPGATFHVGTAGTPASMTVASHAIGGNGTTATFAPDSSLNPDMTL